LQVRQRELHFGDGDNVKLTGSILGQPSQRYALNKGTRTNTPNIEFINLPSCTRWRSAP
jgi:hypothetical protein